MLRSVLISLFSRSCPVFPARLIEEAVFSLESSDGQLKITQLSETLGLANLEGPPGHLLVPPIPRMIEHGTRHKSSLCSLIPTSLIYREHLAACWGCIKEQMLNSSALMKFQSRWQEKLTIRTQRSKIVGVLHEQEMVKSAMKGKKAWRNLGYWAQNARLSEYKNYQ